MGSGIENMFMIGSLSRTPGRMLMMRQALSLYSRGRLHLQRGLCFVCLKIILYARIKQQTASLALLLPFAAPVVHRA